MARCNWTSRSASTHVGSGQQGGTAQRCRHGRISDLVETVGCRTLRYSERGLWRRMVCGAACRVLQRCSVHSYGEVARSEWASRALSHQVLGYWERTLGRLAVRRDGLDSVRLETQRIRASDAQSRSDHFSDCRRRDAEDDDNCQAVVAFWNELDS